jgi:hypothetical protein
MRHRNHPDKSRVARSDPGREINLIVDIRGFDDGSDAAAQAGATA